MGQKHQDLNMNICKTFIFGPSTKGRLYTLYSFPLPQSTGVSAQTCGSTKPTTETCESAQCWVTSWSPDAGGVPAVPRAAIASTVGGTFTLALLTNCQLTPKSYTF